jgi:hypothetical protein
MKKTTKDTTDTKELLRKIWIIKKYSYHLPDGKIFGVLRIIVAISIFLIFTLCP